MKVIRLNKELKFLLELIIKYWYLFTIYLIVSCIAMASFFAIESKKEKVHLFKYVSYIHIAPISINHDGIIIPIEGQHSLTERLNLYLIKQVTEANKKIKNNQTSSTIVRNTSSIVAIQTYGNLEDEDKIKYLHNSIFELIKTEHKKKLNNLLTFTRNYKLDLFDTKLDVLAKRNSNPELVSENLSRSFIISMGLFFFFSISLFTLTIQYLVFYTKNENH